MPFKILRYIISSLRSKTRVSDIFTFYRRDKKLIFSIVWNVTLLVLSYMNPNDMTNSLITISLSQICWFSCILRKITIYTSVTLILVRLATVYVHHTRVLLHLASENGCHFFAPRTQRCRLIGAYKVVVLDSTLWCSTFAPKLFILYKKSYIPGCYSMFYTKKTQAKLNF